MKYITVVGSVGNTAQGFKKTFEYRDTANRPIVVMVDNQDGTVSITLFNSKGVGHTKTGPSDGRMFDIARAHVRAMGYTELAAELADVKAYND